MEKKHIVKNASSDEASVFPSSVLTKGVKERLLRGQNEDQKRFMASRAKYLGSNGLSSLNIEPPSLNEQRHNSTPRFFTPIELQNNFMPSDDISFSPKHPKALDDLMISNISVPSNLTNSSSVVVEPKEEKLRDSLDDLLHSLIASPQCVLTSHSEQPSTTRLSRLGHSIFQSSSPAQEPLHNAFDYSSFKA